MSIRACCFRIVLLSALCGLSFVPAFAGTASPSSGPSTGQAAVRNLEFPLIRRPLGTNLAGMPLLEGGVTFSKEPAVRPSRIPDGLSGVEFAEIPLAEGLKVAGLRGRDAAGRPVHVFDRDTDGDLADDPPVEFLAENPGRVARIAISYTERVAGRPVRRETSLILIERKEGKLEYHFDDAWETDLLFGGERISVALQRWPILFLDTKYSGLYDKIFYPAKEILGLGGRFFRLEIDFPREKLILKETDKRPVDAGFPAPDFEAAVWGTNRIFKLSEQRGKITVLTFWSPLCPGSKAEAVLYDRLAASFSGDARVNFVASITDAAPLEAYMKDHRHSFAHIVGSSLWETYGVTAPFVTFLIDQRGQIVKRVFGFSPDLEKEARAQMKKSPGPAEERERDGGFCADDADRFPKRAK